MNWQVPCISAEYDKAVMALRLVEEERLSDSTGAGCCSASLQVQSVFGHTQEAGLPREGEVAPVGARAQALR